MSKDWVQGRGIRRRGLFFAAPPVAPGSSTDLSALALADKATLGVALHSIIAFSPRSLASTAIGGLASVGLVVVRFPSFTGGCTVVDLRHRCYTSYAPLWSINRC